MIESDEWNIVSSIGKATPKPEDRTIALEEMAKQHLEVSSDIEKLKAKLEQLEGEMAHLFPQEAGERSYTTDTYEVMCNRTERWSWDKDELEKIFGTNELPDYVKRSMTVDKRKFLKLAHSEQEQLKHALTRTLDKPKIKVIPHV